MAKLNHHPGNPESETSHQEKSLAYPSIQELTIQQGTGPITDISILHGGFWPEEESVEEFLAALHDWRGHSQPGSAA